MKAIYSSITMGTTYPVTQHHTPQDLNPWQHPCQHFKLCKPMYYSYAYMIWQSVIFQSSKKLYVFFWVIPRRLNFICRRFGTLCLFRLHGQVATQKKTYNIQNTAKVWNQEYSKKLPPINSGFKYFFINRMYLGVTPYYFSFNSTFFSSSFHSSKELSHFILNPSLRALSSLLYTFLLPFFT